MPVWWGKKSSKLKEDNHHQNHHADRLFNSPKKPKSFEEVLGRVSPRLSRDFTGGGSGGGAGGSSSSTGFSGFESEGKCHPLPRPTTTTGGVGSGDHGVSFGSGNASGSVSSVSSTGSSEEQTAGQDHGGGVLRSAVFIYFLLLGFRGNRNRIEPIDLFAFFDSIDLSCCLFF